MSRNGRRAPDSRMARPRSPGLLKPHGPPRAPARAGANVEGPSWQDTEPWNAGCGSRRPWRGEHLHH
eukprot:6532824-Alexandrium_andersonii.AAC.1